MSFSPGPRPQNSAAQNRREAELAEAAENRTKNIIRTMLARFASILLDSNVDPDSIRRDGGRTDTGVQFQWILAGPPADQLFKIPFREWPRNADTVLHGIMERGVLGLNVAYNGRIYNTSAHTGQQGIHFRRAVFIDRETPDIPEPSKRDSLASRSPQDPVTRTSSFSEDHASSGGGAQGITDIKASTETPHGSQAAFTVDTKGNIMINNQPTTSDRASTEKEDNSRLIRSSSEVPFETGSTTQTDRFVSHAHGSDFQHLINSPDDSNKPGMVTSNLIAGQEQKPAPNVEVRGTGDSHPPVQSTVELHRPSIVNYQMVQQLTAELAHLEAHNIKLQEALQEKETKIQELENKVHGEEASIQREEREKALEEQKAVASAEKNRMLFLKSQLELAENRIATLQRENIDYMHRIKQLSGHLDDAVEKLSNSNKMLTDGIVKHIATSMQEYAKGNINSVTAFAKAITDIKNGLNEGDALSTES